MIRPLPYAVGLTFALFFAIGVGLMANAAAATDAPIGTAWHPISDADADAQADKLLAQMTTEEKQLQLLSYCNNGVPRLGIPNLHAGEALHGVVSRGTTCFPMSIALGATWDPALMHDIGTVVGAEARAVGIHQVFAPMLGLARDARWGRVEESYGEDPYEVSRIAVAYVEGLQGMGDERFGPDHVITTPKHFVADGEPWAGANGEDFDTSERVLREIYFPPFEAVVKEAHTGSIMPAHHALNGVPCHANVWLLDTILRKEWGFNGFVTSDMGDIPKIAGGHKFARNAEDAAVKALSAGVDMELIGELYKGELAKALADGSISIDVVNAAAKRVLRAKIQLLGLLPPQTASTGTTTAPPPGDTTQQTILGYKGSDDIWAKLIAEGKFNTPDDERRPDADKVLGDPAHAALAVKAAAEELVLLKNDGVLPLDRTKIHHIAVVGALAMSTDHGGYSGGTSRPPVNILDGLKTAAGNGIDITYAKGCELTKPADDAEIKAAVDAANSADVVIAVVGFTRGQAGENLDRDDLDLIGGQEALVEAVAATGKPLVVVLYNGGPVTIPWIADHAPAILESWYGGQAHGTAVAQALFGDIDPGGKLNVSFPRTVGQVPCYYNHQPITGPINYYKSKGGVLYAFGHGLSYTKFKYDGLKVDPPAATKTQPATISFTVTNAGAVAGDEVAQVYIRQDDTSLERPVLQLVGFQRVSLQQGESKTVSCPVGFEQVKFWKDGQWVAEPGTISVKIGSASDDIRLNGSVAYGGN
jgi:beta-glucosidase